MKVDILEDIEQIKKMLLKMPIEKVKEVEDFVAFMNTKVFPKEGRKIEKLEGIWKDLGFEKTSNMEREIVTIRQETEGLIAKRGI